jgi:integrase
MARGREEKRERVLRDAEIAAVWQACDRLGFPFGPMVRVLLLTGQRLGEVAEMHPDELDMESDNWLIPAARSKSAREHIVPLADLTRGILAGLPRFAGPFVFSTTDGVRPVSGFSKAKARLDALSGVTGWRFHDLRRTCRTRLAALGTSEIVAERILNHQPKGLIAVYNKHEYLDEKRAALAKWAETVAAIVHH